jgi:hypothetical protein
MLMRRANLHVSKLLFGIFLINEDSPFIKKEMPPCDFQEKRCEEG